MPVGLVIRQLIGIGTGHGIVMPTALLSLMRQMLFLDGITRELDPTFNFLDEGAVALRDALAGGHGAEAPAAAPTGSSAEPTAYAVAA
jgi:predicted unusual protein kinase regulating ubiquinone biosynthesis (AarF/ABC1/UbiB family)